MHWYAVMHAHVWIAMCVHVHLYLFMSLHELACSGLCIHLCICCIIWLHIISDIFQRAQPDQQYLQQKECTGVGYWVLGTGSSAVVRFLLVDLLEKHLSLRSKFKILFHILHWFIYTLSYCLKLSCFP